MPRGRFSLRPILQFGAGNYAAELGRVETRTYTVGSAVSWDVPTAVGLMGFGPAVAFILADQAVSYGSGGSPKIRWTSSGMLVGGSGTFAVPLAFWRAALGTEVRAGYEVHGLGHQVSHGLSVELAVALICWL